MSKEPMFCEECEGYGKVRTDRARGHVVRCPSCNGSGRMEGKDEVQLLKDRVKELENKLDKYVCNCCGHDIFRTSKGICNCPGRMI
jgi:hypothetical protein